MTERRSQRAALLDRDGTIIVDRDYTRDPADVALLPGAAAALRALMAAGYPVIVFTNQSGIARGLVSPVQYHAVRKRVGALLAAEGVTLVDTYVCPHHPDFSGPCECRKPLPALYQRAAAVHELDLSRCIYAGDRGRDVAPGLVFGGRCAMIHSPRTDAADLLFATEHAVPVVAALSDAVSLLLSPDA